MPGRAPLSRVSTAEPLETRVLLADAYVVRPEVLSPPQPGGGGQTVVSAGAVDRVSDDGTRTTVVSGLHRPTGLAVDAQGNLFYVDVERAAGGPTRATLFRRGADGAVTDLGTFFDSGGGTYSIGGWAFDATPVASGVYVNRPQLRSPDDPAVVLTPGSIDHVAADGTRTTVVGGLHQPSGVAVAADGTLYFIDVESGPFRATLFRRGTDGAVSGVGSVFETGDDSGAGIGGWSFDPVVGPTGDVFVNRPAVVARDASRRVTPGGIDRISPSGRRRTALRAAHSPSGLAFDAGGDLYYQDVASGPLRSELFRVRGGRGRARSLGVVADTTGGSVPIGNWAFSTAVDPRVDLVASSLSVTARRRPAMPGGRGAARLSVGAGGSSPVFTSVVVDLYLSADSVLDSSDSPLASQTSVLRLKSGRSRALKLRFTYPAIAAGDYYVVAAVRPATTSDLDASNNTVSTATPVRLGAATA